MVALLAGGFGVWLCWVFGKPLFGCAFPFSVIGKAAFAVGGYYAVTNVERQAAEMQFAYPLPAFARGFAVRHVTYMLPLRHDGYAACGCAAWVAVSSCSFLRIAAGA